MTGLLLVVCSMTLARRLQTHYHQSWSSNVEPGDRRVLPSVARVERSEHTHLSSAVHILKELLVYVKFTNFGSYVRKVRAFYYRAALNAGRSSQEKAACLSVCHMRA